MEKQANYHTVSGQSNCGPWHVFRNLLLGKRRNSELRIKFFTLCFKRRISKKILSLEEASERT